MHCRSKRLGLVILGVVLSVWHAADAPLASGGHTSDQAITVFVDAESFTAAAGPLTEIDFEQLPSTGSIATDVAGNTVTTTGQGVPFGTAARGFTSSSGLAQIRVVSTSGGPVVITTIYIWVPAAVPSLIAALDARVEELAATGVLTAGQRTSLRVKLAAALQSVNQTNARAADNQLRAFLNQVEAFLEAGILTQDQAETLRSLVNEIRSALGVA